MEEQVIEPIQIPVSERSDNEIALIASKNNKRIKMLCALLATLLLLTLTAVLSYHLGIQTAQNKMAALAEISTPTPLTLSASPTARPVEVTSQPFQAIKAVDSVKNGWSTIAVDPVPGSSFERFSISYPTSWKLTPGENDDVFTLTKGDYSLVLSQPGVGGGVCLFPDTDMSKVDEAFKENPVDKTFVEIPFKEGKFRRSPIKDVNNLLGVCEQLKGNALFQVPPNAGGILYHIPDKPNDGIVKEMDSILSTINYIN